MQSRRSFFKVFGAGAFFAGTFASKALASSIELISRTSPNMIVLGSSEELRIKKMKELYQQVMDENDPVVFYHDIFKNQNQARVTASIQDGFKQQCYLLQSDPSQLSAQTLEFIKKNFTIHYV